MSLLPELLNVLDSALSLQGRAQSFDVNTPLLGALPELDSMAVMSVLSALESELGVVIEVGDISADTFSTVGTLLDHVERLRW
jgi:acyl carrier protein